MVLTGTEGFSVRRGQFNIGKVFLDELGPGPKVLVRYRSCTRTCQRFVVFLHTSRLDFLPNGKRYSHHVNRRRSRVLKMLLPRPLESWPGQRAEISRRLQRGDFG